MTLIRIVLSIYIKTEVRKLMMKSRHINKIYDIFTCISYQYQITHQHLKENKILLDLTEFK